MLEHIVPWVNGVTVMKRDCCRMAKSSFLPRRNKGYFGQKVTKTLFGNSPETTVKLLAMSERTVKRRVTEFDRTRGLRKGLSTAKPSDIRYIIPVFKGPWTNLPPGHGQLDTVGHCGASVAGDYVFT